MNLHFPKWMSWENFYTVILKGLKVYAFYLAVLSVFRLFFILWNVFLSNNFYSIYYYKIQLYSKSYYYSNYLFKK